MSRELFVPDALLQEKKVLIPTEQEAWGS